MRTILVTGGAGFIGGTLVRQMFAEQSDLQIVNLDKLTYAGNLDSLRLLNGQARHQFVRGDIGDKVLASQLLSEYRPVAVMHLAAESHVDRSIDNPEVFVKTNVQGTFNLLECVRGYWSALNGRAKNDFRFLHVSTDEVYGSLGTAGAFTEQTRYEPNSPYSASKAASDHFVRAYHHTYRLPTLITNCSNNYGPFQFPEKLIPLMILNALEGKPLPVYGDGMNMRDWLFVEDHCRALRTVLAKGTPGEVYNIGGNCERANIEIVKQVCRLVDELASPPHGPCEKLITHVKDRPGHDRRYAIDANKIHRMLGWEPATEFDHGLRLTVQWYLQNREWIERVQTRQY